ncbi:glycerophosphodiester phosphodiesterase [Nanoarchaeota archaeon]
MKPLILAHKGGDCFGVENSIEAIKESLKHKPDIIEIDLRKSTDDVIFCYHGNTFEYLLAKYFFKKPLNKLKQKYPTVATLKEIAELVQDKSILFLDIKDKSITKKEIQNILKDIKTKEVYFASQNLNYLSNAGKLPKGWKKLCNGGVFRLKPNFSKVLEAGLDAIELFFWDFNDKNIKKLEEHNIESALAKWFLPRKTRINKAFSKKSLFVFDYYFPALIDKKK